MAKGKLDDRLAKLQNFGGSAGAEPAARALEKTTVPVVAEAAPPVTASPVAPPLTPTPLAAVAPPPPSSQPPAPPVAVPPPPKQLTVLPPPKPPQVAIPSNVAAAQTVRNVAFSPHDLEQVDRLETVLLSIKNELGIRVTFADVIRLALYTAHPTKEQAMQIMQSTREQDGRLKQNKKR